MTCRRDANICTWQRHGNLFLIMRVQFQYAGCHWQLASNPPHPAPFVRQYRDATTDSQGHILIINICFNIFKYIPTRFLRRLLRRLHAIRYVPQNVFGETPRGTGVPGDGAFWPSPVSSADAENTSPGKCKCSRQAGSLSGMNARSMKRITYNGIVKGVFHISGRSEAISGTQGIHTLSDNRQQRMQKKTESGRPIRQARAKILLYYL